MEIKITLTNCRNYLYCYINYFNFIDEFVTIIEVFSLFNLNIVFFEKKIFFLWVLLLNKFGFVIKPKV